jgi:hypothetical protein
MPNLDQFFHRRITPTYKCLDHSHEVWAELTGEDLRTRISGVHTSVTDRSISLVGAKSFVPLDKPISPCIVLMQRRFENPHVGIFYKGSIMHLGASGVEYQPVRVASRDYTSVRYYR